MFNKYKRTGVSEARAVTGNEVKFGCNSMESDGISVSEEDKLAGSPKIGDMIARNPQNHNDQWLISAKYFNNNFEKE